MGEGQELLNLCHYMFTEDQTTNNVSKTAMVVRGLKILDFIDLKMELAFSSFWHSKVYP